MEEDIVIRLLARVAASTFQTSALLLKFLTLRIIDLLCLLLNILALCTVIRIPAICYAIGRQFRTSSNSRGFTGLQELWYFLGLFQLGVFIVDIPFMLMSLPLMVFFWRAILLLREHGPITFEREGSRNNEMNNFGYTGWKLRKLIWKHFCLLCTDFFFIPFSIILTFSWRSSRFRQLLSEQYSSNDELRWKKMIVKEFLILCNEMICFPFILFFLLSWASRRTRKKIVSSTRRGRISDHDSLSDLEVLGFFADHDDLGDCFLGEWWIVISESFNFILDLATLPILVFLLLSWRCRLAWLIFKPWYMFNLSTSHPSNRAAWAEEQTRGKIWIQFFKLVADSFFIPPMILVILSWRVLVFYRSVCEIYLMERDEGLRQELIMNKKFEKLRKEIISHAARLVSDVLCLLQFLVILLLAAIFPWRLYKTLTSVWQEYKSNTLTEKFVKDCIFEEFMLALRDIPTSMAGLLLLLTVWRVPFLLHEYIRIRNDTSHRTRISNLVTDCIFRQLALLAADILATPFVIGTMISIWRIRPFVKEVRNSRTPSEAVHWQWFLASYDGGVIRTAAVVHSLSFIFIDLPCFCLFLVNVALPLRIIAIVSSMFNCGNFYTEYPIIIITETLNLLVDLFYIAFGSILFVFRPISVVVNLLEDERHRKARELSGTIDTVRFLTNKSQKCAHELEDMVNLLVKVSSTVDGNLCKYLLSKVVVDYSTDMEHLKKVLADKYVDDRFIHLISKYLFLFDKQGYFMYRRFLVEKLHLKRPSYYARLKNLDLFHSEYSAYLANLKKTEQELLDFAVDKPPLWSESAGILLRSRKENHKVIVKTLTTGYFATIALVLLNCVLIYRAVPLLHQIINEPYLIRKKAIKNLHQYWLDFKTLLQILLVILSIYRCLDLMSDLIVDLFYKRSIKAMRKTVAAYPPQIKDDLLMCLSLIFRWKTVAYLIASVLFFCFIPLSALFNIGKTFSTDSRKVLGGIIVIYTCIIVIPIGIICEKDETLTLLQHQLFEYLTGITSILVLFLGVSSKKPHRLPPVDYVRLNWGLIHVIIQEACQLGQILGLLFRLSLAIDPDRWYNSVFKMFLFETDDQEFNLVILNSFFYCWFLISSAPVILEGILKYVPEGRFSNNNFSWQFMLSLLGSVTSTVIPYLGCVYLGSKTENGLLMWQNEPFIAAKCLIFLVWFLLTATVFYCRYFNSANPLFDLHFSPIYNSIINIIKLALVLFTVLVDVTVLTKIIVMLVSIIVMIVVTVFYSQIVYRISSLANQQACNSNMLKYWRLSILLSISVILVICLLTEIFPLLFASTLGVGIPLTLAVMITSITAKSYGFSSHSVNEEARKSFIGIVKEIESTMRNQSKETLKWEKTRSGWLNLLSAARLANEQDKQAEQTSEELSLEDESTPLMDSAPPAYHQLNDEGKLPSYHSVNNFEPPTDYDTGEDFIPDMEYLTSPVGTWQPYSAACLVKELDYLSGYCDFTQTITDRKCTGSNVLLILEKHIHYTGLTRVCVQKLVVWRALVASADWPGLVKYAKMLRRSLTCQYDTPTQDGIVKDLMDIDFLKPLADDSFFPEFVEDESLFEIKLKIHKKGRQALLSVLPTALSPLFAKLIPEDHPMIHKITTNMISDKKRVTCDFFKTTKITITSVPGEGFKIAAGASIEIPKTLVIEEITDNIVKFTPPYPVASKSFLSVSIPLFRIFDVGGTLKIGISNDSGKTAEFEKALQTLSNLSWS